MRHFKVLGLLALATLGVMSCSPTKYIRAAEPGKDGYTETPLSADTWMINFRGNAYTPKETVERYIFYRSAELTIEKGFECFKVLEGSMNDESTVSSSIFQGKTTYGSSTNYVGTKTIKMYRGDCAAAGGTNFVASEMKTSLEPYIRRNASSQY